MIQDNENARKYFLMIQDIIKRMAQNSFMLKGWSLTIYSVVIAFNLANLQWVFFLNAIIIIGFFWVLDSYYLRQERLFRKLWEKKVDLFNNDREELNKNLFDMDTKKIQSSLEDKQKVKNIFGVMFSTTECLFYLPIEVISIIFMIVHLT
ncbi:hypothetical protein DSAG12_02662 [Promethearchaeum syntrophicum]|uniref:Uncharacterized protein n=1 Tax=Promethearchaeum syntrophicum TaxID=2594042 RepID=A0A5B9DCJ5_9ARCH|nr:hypothetical protein [Candidatus Prometheoarchaeum syntrophicum]QEE16832.1 hypothetical protein DSAG12_02662 [Candidatus Prometheoarchaeum syntrophicum]